MNRPEARQSLILGMLFRRSRLGWARARRQAPKSYSPLGATIEPSHMAIAAGDSDPLSTPQLPEERIGNSEDGVQAASVRLAPN